MRVPPGTLCVYGGVSVGVSVGECVSGCVSGCVCVDRCVCGCVSLHLEASKEREILT